MSEGGAGDHGNKGVNDLGVGGREVSHAVLG